MAQTKSPRFCFQNVSILSYSRFPHSVSERINILWWALETINWNFLPHIYYTKYLKDRVEDVRPPWLFFPVSVPKKPGSRRRWCRWSGFAEQVGKGSFTKCPGTKEDTWSNRSVVELFLSTYGNLSPDSALAAWRWTGHIWKQVTLIKICLDKWEGENTNVLKSLYTGMFIQSPVA